MTNYEAPSIVELGSVADFTRADHLAPAYDGYIFLDSPHDGGNPTS